MCAYEFFLLLVNFYIISNNLLAQKKNTAMPADSSLSDYGTSSIILRLRVI
jgi:hypothetical protein